MLHKRDREENWVPTEAEAGGLGLAWETQKSLGAAVGGSSSSKPKGSHTG